MLNQRAVIALVMLAMAFPISSMRIQVGLMSASGLSQQTPVYDGPIFDVHVNAGAMNVDLVRVFMSNLEQVGVAKSVLNGFDDSVDRSFKIMRFKQMYPDRVLASLYFGNQYNQANSSSAVSAAEQAYDKGLRMFGEMLLKHVDDCAIPADDSNVLKIFDIAASKNIPVLVHHDRDYQELERALRHNRNTTVIFHGWRGSWTRCDFSPEGFRKLLLDHYNLMVALDTLRFPWIGAVFMDQSTGILKKEWKDLFEEMPYRFVVGSDFYDPEKDFSLDSVRSFANLYRGMLGQLSHSAAKRFAYQNLEGILSGKPFTHAVKAMDDANASIQEAMAEGRTSNIEKAKVLLVNATAVFEKGEFDNVVMLARQAKSLADTSTKPATETASRATTQIVTTPTAEIFYTQYAVVGTIAAVLVIFGLLGSNRIRKKQTSARH